MENSKTKVEQLELPFPDERVATSDLVDDLSNHQPVSDITYWGGTTTSSIHVGAALILTFKPKKNITTWELAKCMPYLLGNLRVYSMDDKVCLTQTFLGELTTLTLKKINT